MNHPVIKAIVLISFLIFCLPGVSAAGDFTIDDTVTPQNAPDFSSCDITNGSPANPYCPLWDGEHTQPDPYLVYELRKKIVTARLETQGITPQQSDYGILSLPPPQSEFPTTGTVRVPVFLVDFSDAPHDPNQTVADVQSKMFGNGSGGYPYESLKNYYQRSSYNQLIISGDVYGWYRAAQPRSYYQNMGKTEGRKALINEILQVYNNQINFANYDSNGNGKIDALFIKWAGSDTGWGSFWWASMSGVYSDVIVDGVTPRKFVWSWYSNPNGGAYSPQVDMHETGHILGLPDYYDYDSGIGPKGGLGGWDMMDHNWGDHNAFSKYLLGWIDPIVISSGTHQIILPPSGTTSSDNTVLIMPNAVPDSFGEFFLVQYREPGTGNDPFKTGLNKAVWIWHVDSTLSGGGGYLYDNSYTDHKLLRLMEADGLEQIEAGNGYLDVYDFYLPGKALGPGTVPNSNSYSGSTTNVAVANMQQLDSSMQVDFSIAGAPVATVAGFSANVTSGTAPLTVKFTDSSAGAGISVWSWDFDNDTIIDSISQNPVYTFASPGTYTVNLTVTGTGGSDSEVGTGCINVTPRESSNIGIYQNGVWYLDSNGNGLWDTGIDNAYNFGAPGWSPVLGDWNADGKTDIGVYQDGIWYRDYNGNGAWDTGIDNAYNFGMNGWSPVIGNWG